MRGPTNSRNSPVPASGHVAEAGGNESRAPFHLGSEFSRLPWLENHFQGQHPLLCEARAAALRAAQSDWPILITGETGTGKDLLAQGIHLLSSRGGKPAQVIAVSSLGETAWSVLFGHRKGSFTGAVGDHQGIFCVAGGTTIILEDVADLPLRVQPMLLRAVEHRIMRPLGSDSEVRSDFRIIATSNLPLEGEVAEGRFRADLFQRLSVLHIHLPPLREHLDDLRVYVPHFLEKAVPPDAAPKGISAAALRILEDHSWPRNIRELEHVLYRASVEATGDVIGEEDLKRIHPSLTGGRPSRPSQSLSRATVIRALEQTKGNKREAARLLGVSPGTLYTLIKKHRIFG